MAQSNLGKVMLTPRGNYSAGATYNMLDFVLYGGASFVALENDLRGVTPSADSPSWQLLAAAAEEITVVSQEVEYAAQAAADYTGDPPESGWSSEIPPATNGNYLWTRIITTYSDGSSFTAYLVAKNGVNGSGAVSSVNGVSPDASGNVLLNIGSIATVDSTPTAGSTNLVTSGGVNQFVYGVITNKENISNKVSAWSATPNDNRYPSEKLVKDSLNALAAEVSKKADKSKIKSITLSSTWTGASSPYSQAVTISGYAVTANTKVDLQPASNAIQQLIDDGVLGLYIINNNGTLTAYAIGEKPTASLTIQATLSEVTV